MDKPECPGCGKVHDNVLELAEALASSFTEAAFPDLWQEAKQDIKAMKKKEIAEEMFYHGAWHMLSSLIDREDFPEEVREKIRDEARKEG